MANLKVNGEPLRLAGDARDLAAHLSFTRAPRPGAVRERGEAAAAATERCGLAPLPFDARAELAASKTGQQACYGREVTRLSKAHRRKYRTATMRAIWGTRRKRRSPALVLAPLAPGHRMDPDQVCLLYTSPSPRDKRQSRMPSSA